MKRWRDCLLGDVITLQRGFDITKSQQIDGQIPIISSSGINSFHNKAKCEGPGVITGRKGTLGKVFFSKEQYWPHDTTLWVKDFKGNSEEFVYYFLKILKLEIYDVGASNPTLNRNHLHRLKIKFPPLPIQKKIAAVLSAYDDLIENNNRRIALLEKAAEELYREWFVRMRFPGHQDVKIVKGVPEGWEVKKVGEVVEFLSRGISPKYSEVGKIVLNQRCIRNGKIDFGYARNHETSYSSIKNIRRGDVLVNSTGVGTLGRISVCLDEYFDVTVDSHITIVRANPERINTSFFGAWLSTMQEYFEYMSSGATGQTELGKSIVEGLSLLYPPIQIQDKFEVYREVIVKKIYLMQKQISNLKTTRDRLLSRLMSGKLDVEEIDIRFPAGMAEEAV